MIQEIVSRFAPFSASDCKKVEQELKHRKLTKNEVLLREGEICKSAYFIQSGSLIQYQMDEIEQQIIDLHIENEWFLNHSSFIAQKPSATTITAFEESEILELSVCSLHKLIETSPVFFALGKILEQAQERALFFDNSFSPAEKYNYILESRPQLIQKFPLKLISSYLKIAPETLSRVRSSQ
ncbi:MAG: Crp/Fnr family transcriptional regulator [Bacteroidota bacterium]